MPSLEIPQTVEEQKRLSRQDILERVRSDGEAPRESLFEDLADLYPPFIVREAEAAIAKWRERGFSAPESILRVIAHEEAAEIIEQYRDSTTGLVDGDYLRKALPDMLRAHMADASRPAFEYCGSVSIDLNGLKAVNDLNGGNHALGDQYLRLAAETLKESTTLNDLRAEGARITIARVGGDEFRIMVVGDPRKPLDWSRIRQGIESEIGAIDASAALNNDTITKELGPVPENFRFHASAGVGTATLEETLSSFETENMKSKHAISAHDAPETIINNLMGRLFELADTSMQAHKEKFKDSLLRGDDIDSVMSTIIARTDEAKKMNQQLRILHKLVTTARREADKNGNAAFAKFLDRWLAKMDETKIESAT